jgi:hypothetical protein
MSWKMWGALALLIGGFWFYKSRPKFAGMVAQGWGGGATANLPAMTPVANRQTLGGMGPAVPPNPGAGYQPDLSGGNNGSGGW